MFNIIWCFGVNAEKLGSESNFRMNFAILGFFFMKVLINFFESKCNSGDPVCEIGCKFRLLAKYGVVSSRMRATLASVEDVPVDIRSCLLTNIRINSSL